MITGSGRITVIDDFLWRPEVYRENALHSSFSSVSFGADTFHGISPRSLDSAVPASIAARFTSCVPTLSFLRQSPEGQKEPNFVHSDAGMGDWTAILYLNPSPPEGDGTTFWEDASGRRERCKVMARFNRLLLFLADCFHSRSIFDNYGQGDEARLIQVTFGIIKVQ